MHRNSLYLLLASILKFTMGTGVVLALWVFVIQSGLAPNLARMCNEVAAGLTSAV